MREAGMLGLFKKNRLIELKAPVTGTAIPLAAVPDRVFAAKMVGDGIAFEPQEGVLYAPVNGIVESVFPTKHAIGIRTPEDLRVIIHIGIDTVHLHGDGFESLVHPNQTVSRGMKLLLFDLDLLKTKAKSIMIPMIIVNPSRVESLALHYGAVDVHTTVMTVTLRPNRQKA
jgi:PTS system glucose-specific IIA component